ncbi:MAG: cell wall-binding repeat-containing protein, partial [Microterricola sp.]
MLAASSGFDPGNIISDYNFFNPWAMSEGEIQAFLDAKISGPCENSNCLNVLRVNTPNASWSWGTCAPYSGAANESAARIIFKVQQACGLSAKVILVTLQKEQSLVTRTGPSSEVLRKAMGMGCPDTDVCDSQYYGFFNQVYAAARQLTWYTNPESSMYRSKKYEVGQVKPVQYHPNAGCGAPGVLIKNVATAALYWYTPYQPNAASLGAGWGASSDPCSSYGNRNFSLYYNAWFGNPTGTPTPASARIAGVDRFDTAVAISTSSYAAGAPIAYVTTGTGFADALAAGPAAAAQGGPLLLSRVDFVPESTLAELRRLKVKNIVVVGGEAAVNSAAFAQLAAIAPTKRIAGNDRFDTSRKLAQAVFPTAGFAYVATGINFPDALSASAAAGAAKVPVILIDGRVESGTGTVDLAGEVLKGSGAKLIKIAGGTSVIPAALETRFSALGFSTKRLAGSDRYTTSIVINRDAFPKATTAYIATGMSFSDALAGSAAAAKAGSPLYVSYPWCVFGELRADLNERLKVSDIRLLGGPSALGENVAYLAGC